MFDLFKKNTVETGNVQSKEDKIISAKEALDVSSKEWQTLSTEEIFEKIYRMAKGGFRDATFYASYITGAQLTQLKELGYEVKIATTRTSNVPYVKVSW